MIEVGDIVKYKDRVLKHSPHLKGIFKVIVIEAGIEDIIYELDTCPNANYLYPASRNEIEFCFKSTELTKILYE